MILDHNCTIINVYLNKIIDNYFILYQGLKQQCEIAAVVKANSYGLGQEHVVPALLRAGCRKFCVSSLHEALLSAVTQGSTTYIMHGVNSLGMARECAMVKGFVPVLNHLGQIAYWNQVAKEKNCKLPAVIQFDTGMGRFGLSHSEVLSLADNPALLEYIDVEYVMSHMSCAEKQGHPMTQTQLNLFTRYMQFFPGKKATFANSAGIFLGQQFHFDMVRPGCALYGINPTSAAENPMHSVVELYGYIVQKRVLENDQFIGYAAQHQAKKGDKLIIVECGYADGYVRSLSGKGFCYVAGYNLPVVGIISMDVVIIDASCLPSDIFNKITHVELLGDHVTIDDVAKYASTISYEILITRFGARAKRFYIS